MKGAMAPLGVQSVGGTPFEDLEVDITEMPRSRGYKYLLVLLCSSSSWVEFYPTQTEKTQEVAKLLR